MKRSSPLGKPHGKPTALNRADSASEPPSAPHAKRWLLTALLSLANGDSAVRLIDSLLNGHIDDARALLRWGGAIWLTNIVIFALWYWELDRGGPAARAAGDRRFPESLDLTRKAA